MGCVLAREGLVHFFLEAETEIDGLSSLWLWVHLQIHPDDNLQQKGTSDLGGSWLMPRQEKLFGNIKIPSNFTYTGGLHSPTMVLAMWFSPQL